MGYHLKEIKRGVYGELSKIREEVDEMEDAAEQGNKLMVLIELSDLVGAIKGYLEKEYGDQMNLDDLVIMALATKRAFESGARK